MTFKEQLEQSIAEFQKVRIQKMEARIKESAIDGYKEERFTSRFYDESVIDYFKNKGLNVELKYDHFDREKVREFILKW